MPIRRLYRDCARRFLARCKRRRHFILLFWRTAATNASSGFRCISESLMIARFSALKKDHRECVFDCIAVPSIFTLSEWGQGPSSEQSDPASTLARHLTQSGTDWGHCIPRRTARQL